MTSGPSTHRAVAEFVGTAFLLMSVVGSGIMAENLSAGNNALALLGNTLPTGAMLVVLILIFGPISGAHFNPIVSLAFAIRGQLSSKELIIFVFAQIVGALIGVWIAHGMFDLPLIQASMKARTGSGQWLAETIATLGLIMTIFGCLKTRSQAIPLAVGLYIVAAYWFTASTSFANPAVTLARSLTNTFSGIAPNDVAGFIIAQLIGGILGTYFVKWMWSEKLI
jgi:glycerol uptake facilitator-like aquaporin